MCVFRRAKVKVIFAELLVEYWLRILYCDQEFRWRPGFFPMIFHSFCSYENHIVYCFGYNSWNWLDIFINDVYITWLHTIDCGTYLVFVIVQFQYTPQHLVRMLQIIVDGNCDLAVRQVASIHFKNFVSKNWSPHDPGMVWFTLIHCWGEPELVAWSWFLFLHLVWCRWTIKDPARW